MRNTMFQIFGKSESMTCLNRLFLVGLAVEPNKELSVEELVGRLGYNPLDADIVRSGCDCLVYAGLFVWNHKNDTFFVPEL